MITAVVAVRVVVNETLCNRAVLLDDEAIALLSLAFPNVLLHLVWASVLELSCRFRR